MSEQLSLFAPQVAERPRKVAKRTTVTYDPKYVHEMVLTKPERLIALRDYQQAAVDAILARHEAGTQRLLLVLPTGAGKTVCFSEVIRERMPGRALVIAHREELIQQAADKFRMVTGGAVPVGIVKAERNELGFPVTVASVQTIAGQRRMNQLLAAGAFDTVVIDEAHHAVSPSYHKVMRGLGCYEAGGPLTVGVTATPDRSDRKGLHAAFDEIAYEAKLRDLIAKGYLCDIRAARVQIPVDFSKIRTTAGDYNQGDVERAFAASHAEEKIAEAIALTAEGRKRVLIFTPSVESAHRVAEAMNKVGHSCGVVDGGMSPESRRAVFADFAAGRIGALANCMVATEGYDEPLVDCVVIARPTQSRGLYTQMVGRGTRTAPGKTDCLIVDCVGASSTHKLQTISALTGLPLDQPKEDDGEGTGGGGWSMPSFLELLRAYGGLVDGDGSVSVEHIDLFGNSWARWIPVDGRWVLPAGSMTYVLIPRDGGLWDVVSKAERAAFDFVAKGLDLGYAQGYAEQRAEKMAKVLVSRDAKWRDHAPSAGQLNMLRRFKLNPNDYPTKGDASDAISAAMVADELKGANL